MKTKHLIIGGLIGLIIIKGRKLKPIALVRGIRNNNPGNIRAPREDYWEGQRGVDREGFAIFPSPEWGIRALGKLLLNYEKLHGITTVGGIIERYAPANENNTKAYIDAVCDELSVFSIWPISVEKRLSELVTAIIKHENGLQPYSDALIERGLQMIG